MNYEKKYKEALERAREMYKQGMSTERLEYVFPELEKSKDEKIIDAIKHGLKYLGWEHVDGIRISDMVAWLEKLKDRYIVGVDMGISTGDKGCVVDFENANIPQKDFSPKIEPKFKVGDWVVFNNQHNSVYQIEKIENYEYTLRHFLGGSMPLSFSHEDMIRAWNIQDAKDGDVLYFDNLLVHGSGILIYKADKSSHYIITKYCSVNEFGFEPNSYITLNDGYIIPATKEQRDILFQKMKESGYEWDADNKELKKIEQNPTERSLPYEKNETAEKLIALAECLEMDGFGDCLFNGLSGDDYGKLLRVLAIELTEIKPAWSEEDEKIIKEACKIINCYGNIITEQNEANKAYRIADKLKSLKDRF